MSWSKRKSKRKSKQARRVKRKLDPSKWTVEVVFMPPQHGLEVERVLSEMFINQEQKHD